MIQFFQKTLILAFEANSALYRENETKIVKIIHSAIGSHIINYNSWLIKLKSSEEGGKTAIDKLNQPNH